MTTAQTVFEALATRSPHRRAPRLGVFDDNRQKPIHRWYPFVEGYSAELVARALDDLPATGVLLDPFGGSGTTALTAALAGRDSLFCEINPYLAWVADVKVNRSRRAHSTGGDEDLRALAEALATWCPDAGGPHPLIDADTRRGFFPEGVAETVVASLRLAEKLCGPDAVEIAKLAIATALIPASNMIRRTDLRKRRPGDPPPQPFMPRVIENLFAMADDLGEVGADLNGTTTRVVDDARQLPPLYVPVDLVVTSPPYLNGTNYCRNTKLELLALGLVAGESELADLRLGSIAAGINNISRRRSSPDVIPSVEVVATALDEVAYDSRIPSMVRMYFSDMLRVFDAVRSASRPGTRWLLDIGDSKFSGVHVPTHELLCDVASMARWTHVSTETIRTRRSYDGSQLTQVLLELRAA